jgi:Pyruvate/2-oxoacid:ferredoxin oxidoreductase delta subunit
MRSDLRHEQSPFVGRDSFAIIFDSEREARLNVQSSISKEGVPMLETIISVAGAINTAASLYETVSTVFTGNKTEQHLQQLSQQLNTTQLQVESLSDSIRYVPELQGVRDVTKSRQEIVDDLRQVRSHLEPVQRALEEDIVSSAMIWIPDKMKTAMVRNSWEVLLEIRPASLATRPTNSDLMPVMFEREGTQYIGWQLRGTLPMLFDCEYGELMVPKTESTTGLEWLYESVETVADSDETVADSEEDDTQYFIKDDCIRCGECAEQCPVEAILEYENGFFINKAECIGIGCGVCADLCPTDAIVEM